MNRPAADDDVPASAPARGAGRLTEAVRTCVGCRQRATASSLVRVVAVREATTWVVVPDLGRSLPGRGAHVHPEPRCLDLAARRKAWGRALRLEGPLDLSRLASLAERPDQHP